MSEIIQLKNTLIVWSLANGFIDLATLLNGELSLNDFLIQAIQKDNDLSKERENQIRIQNERLKTDLTDPDREARKEKIVIIENQKKAIDTRMKFYQETLEDLKK